MKMKYNRHLEIWFEDNESSVAKIVTKKIFYQRLEIVFK
jgi:hypothetical protein